jgi:hypothetical protein
MRYLDLINNCKIRIDNEFYTFASNLKDNELFSKLYSKLSSYSFLNEFQLVDVTLSYYIPEIKNSDEDGIDISIGLFQSRKKEYESTVYTSNIKYDENGDLIFDKFLYITSSISTTTGAYVLDNVDYVISISDVYSFEKELSNIIDKIFVSFKSSIELMSSKLYEIKNCT